MTEPFPLQPLLDLANNKMDDAARKLGELIASEHAVEEKLALLVEYRKEYQARFVETARNGIGPDAWRNFSAFLVKLDDAIAHQQRIVSDSKRRVEQGQQNWVDQRNKVKSLRHPVAPPPEPAGPQGSQAGTTAHRRTRRQAIPRPRPRRVIAPGRSWHVAC